MKTLWNGSWDPLESPLKLLETFLKPLHTIETPMKLVGMLLKGTWSPLKSYFLGLSGIFLETSWKILRNSLQAFWNKLRRPTTHSLIYLHDSNTSTNIGSIQVSIRPVGQTPRNQSENHSESYSPFLPFQMNAGDLLLSASLLSAPSRFAPYKISTSKTICGRPWRGKINEIWSKKKIKWTINHRSAEGRSPSHAAIHNNIKGVLSATRMPCPRPSLHSWLRNRESKESCLLISKLGPLPLLLSRSPGGTYLAGARLPFVLAGVVMIVRRNVLRSLPVEPAVIIDRRRVRWLVGIYISFSRGF